MRATIWDELTVFSDAFTCYSAAVAAWTGCEREEWSEHVDPGLYLGVAEAGENLFGFAHFPATLRGRLGLVPCGSADGEATAPLAAVRAELERSGRVIVAGDGFNLPWHVACGRRHVPHWFVLVAAPGGAEVLDPFACRNDLGQQAPYRALVTPEALSGLIAALPGDDPVFALRERFAFGDALTIDPAWRWRWFEAGATGTTPVPARHEGPAAVRTLAAHFRRHGQDPAAYRQADDLWSIGRHRAFTAGRIAQRASGPQAAEQAAWLEEHGGPLARRWGHVAPLILQAKLSLNAGRAASESLPDLLDRLAEMELAAGQSLARFTNIF